MKRPQRHVVLIILCYAISAAFISIFVSNSLSKHNNEQNTNTLINSWIETVASSAATVSSSSSPTTTRTIMTTTILTDNSNNANNNDVAIDNDTDDDNNNNDDDDSLSNNDNNNIIIESESSVLLENATDDAIDSESSILLENVTDDAIDSESGILSENVMDDANLLQDMITPTDVDINNYFTNDTTTSHVNNSSSRFSKEMITNNSIYHRSFPIWDDPFGINIQHIIQFIHDHIYDETVSTVHPAKRRQLYNELFYILDDKGVYASRTLHNRTNIGILNYRVNPKIKMFKLAYRILFNIETAMTSTKSKSLQYKGKTYNRLREVIFHQGGLPILTFIGDYSGCCYNNWNEDNQEEQYLKDLKKLQNSIKKQQKQKPNNKAALVQMKSTNKKENSFSSIIQSSRKKEKNNKQRKLKELQSSSSSLGLPISLPILTVAARIDCNYSFPMPTYKTILDSKANASVWKKIMKNWSITYPYEYKLKQIVWRGGLTGDLMKYQSPRWRLPYIVTQESLKNKTIANMFNVGLHRLPTRHMKAKLNLTDVGGIIPGIYPADDYQKYIGIIDIDGNSWSSRYGSLLCYNSIILKVDALYVDYFYNNPIEYPLLPYIHYIPIQYDLSNLIEQTEYVLNINNSNIIKQIIRNANQWCMKRMIHTSIAHDFLTIFESYISYLDLHDTQKLKNNNNTTTTTKRMTKTSLSKSSVQQPWTTQFNEFKMNEIFKYPKMYDMKLV